MRLGRNKRIALGVVFAAAISSHASAADSSFQQSCPPPWKTPLVPTKATAKAIYLAVGRGQQIPMFKDYPIVMVEDKGDHWSVWQERGKPPPTPKANEVIVSAGGGQLSMDIDKCTGAISNVGMNR